MKNIKTENFELLDLITILGFCAQLRNIEQDTKETNFIHIFIKAIANEIQLLHKENDLIINKLEKIENKLGVKNEIN